MFKKDEVKKMSVVKDHYNDWVNGKQPITA